VLQAHDAANLRTQPASVRERRVAFAVIGGLFLLSVAVIALHDPTRFVVPAFVAGYVGSTGTADTLSAVLLLVLYRAEMRRELLYAALAYVFNALLIVPYALTFPEVVDVHGMLGNEQSAAFLWITWHITFAVTLGIGFSSERGAETQRPGLVATRFIAGAVVASIALTIIATVGRAGLPHLVDRGTFTPLYRGITCGVSLLSLVATLVVRRSGTFSSLRLWLAVALVASALDTTLNVLSPGRFSLAWIVGKFEQFVTASVVLFSMLRAWSSTQMRMRSLTERLANIITERNVLQDDFDRENRASKAFQEAALPEVLPQIAGLGFAAVYRAANHEAMVGGDWYDAFRIDDGRVILSVGDVMGSGLGAAVTMNAVRQSMRGAAQLFADPVAILDAADRALRSERPESIVTAFVAILDPITHSLAYASAGHPPAILRDGDGHVRMLAGTGVPLGIRPMDRGEPERTQTIDLPDPSILVLYTDGLTEITRDVLAGESRLCSFVASPAILESDNPARAIANALIENAHDDVAIVTVFVDGTDTRTQRVEGDRGTHWSFPADSAQHAEHVRGELGQLLRARGATETDLAITGLIWSELVGNVYRHAGGAADVVLDRSGPAPVLHVLDRGAGFTFVSRLPSNELAESGRGLFVVSQIARDLSVVAREGGGSHARVVLPFELARE
jgi:serine phosphatase RsbU (regulator of sigma subunit)/anti-sigma regulatory factor (Ser/Thr protein kinase)